MTNTPGKRRHANMALYEADYGLELARGSSHIASMLSAVTLDATVTEVVVDFVLRHGTDELSIFLNLLAARLDARQKPAAASVVRHVDAFRSVQAIPEPAKQPRGSRQRSEVEPKTVSATARPADKRKRRLRPNHLPV